MLVVALRLVVSSANLSRKSRVAYLKYLIAEVMYRVKRTNLVLIMIIVLNWSLLIGSAR